jgi:hypothetical protein
LKENCLCLCTTGPFRGWMPASANVFHGDTVLAPLSLPHGPEVWHTGWTSYRECLIHQYYFHLHIILGKTMKCSSSHPHWFIESLTLIIVFTKWFIPGNLQLFLYSLEIIFYPNPSLGDKSIHEGHTNTGVHSTILWNPYPDEDVWVYMVSSMRDGALLSFCF